MRRFLLAIFGIALSFLLLLTALETATFRLETYRELDAQYNIQKRASMSEEQLNATMADLLSYLFDSREVLDTRAIINGEERAVFNEKEILHMIDVKFLFKLAFGGQLLCGILVVGIAAYLIFKRQFFTRGTGIALLLTAIVNVILFAILAVLMQSDFTQYFTYFHEIFFSNDLWLLNPRTDVLIQMLPEAVFSTLAMQIGLLYAGSMAIVALIGGGFYFMNKKRKPANS
ncbi:TIGR01906 family membrane protein [Culicoidibacter larvae]|uniref:TIGR01906 family membrane protein n=1 Tax=Culicoidibacter larvae TaxID=2579976 RepID=A0A5R8QB97_9FIRM|nr:TIGR01906 family membrane protein [Culicoidibacter larvae]TLG73792.1 TIGR01906 family membrane protein [Culicoidibacter larvae]